MRSILSQWEGKQAFTAFKIVLRLILHASRSLFRSLPLRVSPASTRSQRTEHTHTHIQTRTYIRERVQKAATLPSSARVVHGSRVRVRARGENVVGRKAELISLAAVNYVGAGGSSLVWKRRGKRGSFQNRGSFVEPTWFCCLAMIDRATGIGAKHSSAFVGIW